MHPSTLSLESILQHQQNEINKDKDDISKIKDNYHHLDKNILALRSELKKDREITRQEMYNLSNKIDQLGDNSKKIEEYIKEQTEALSERVDVLEVSHTERQRWFNIALKVAKIMGKLWWIWVLFTVCCYAFDIEFKVRNPHLVSLLMDIIQSKL